MPTARITCPDKTAMQSGKAKDSWLIEFVPETPYFTEPLMGWTGMTETPREIRLRFPTRDAAVAYAKRKRLAYEVLEPHARSQVKKAYADNFKFDRTQ